MEYTLAGAEHTLGGVVFLQPTTYFMYIDIEVDIDPFLFLIDFADGIQRLRLSYMSVSQVLLFLYLLLYSRW